MIVRVPPNQAPRRARQFACAKARIDAVLRHGVRRAAHVAPQRRPKPTSRRPGKAGYLFVAPYILLLVAVGIYPVGYAIDLALTSFTAHFSGLTNFISCYHDFRFLPAFEH